MRKSTIIIILSFLFVNILNADESSFENILKLKKRVKCDVTMNHMMGLLENDPDMKKMGPEIIKKMREGFEKEKEKRLDRCVDNFNQEEVDCILSLESLKDAEKCNVISKKIRSSKKTRSMNNGNYYSIYEKSLQCNNTMNHMIGLLENDPGIKKMEPEVMKKMKEDFEKERDKRLDECVDNFNQEEVDCIMDLKSLKDVRKCNLKK